MAVDNHIDVVQDEYNKLVAKGWKFLGAEGIFELAKRVAWALRSLGFGLLKKTGGNNAFGYSTDKILSPDLHIVDIFSDDGKGGGTPRWTVGGTFTREGFADPFDPDGPVVVNGDAGGHATGGGGGAAGASGIERSTALITPQLNLLEDEIVYRLASLAVNVLQPLKNKYPNIVVVSGLRQVNTGIGQHELAEAVDVQVRNQTPELLYEVADYIHKSLNFDQLILNWTDVGTQQGWIHVSFTTNGTLRYQVLTKDFADVFHDGLFICDPLDGEERAQALRAKKDEDDAILTELQDLQSRQQRTDSGGANVKSALHVEAVGNQPTAAVVGTTNPAPGFGLDSVAIVASTDVRDWSVTTHITKLGFNPGVLHIEFDKQATWPSIQLSDGTLQQSTLWVFLNIDGQWYASAAERLLPNQQNKAEDTSFSKWIAKTWFYDPARWGAMTGYVPQVGERVGFMVTNGSLRQDTQWKVTERSDILWVNWPQDGTSVIFP